MSTLVAGGSTIEHCVAGSTTVQPSFPGVVPLIVSQRKIHGLGGAPLPELRGSRVPPPQRLLRKLGRVPARRLCRRF
jgi:hypothetical protein